VLPVFLDTCVLLKPYLCDALLSIAEAGVYRPLWSPMMMGELERTSPGEDSMRNGSPIGSSR